MNKNKFLDVLRTFGDTQKSLAEAMGITRTTLNNKVNERHGSSFTQLELTFIKGRYKLSAEEMTSIFF